MLNLLKIEVKSSRFKWANIILISVTLFMIVTTYIFKDFDPDYVYDIYFLASIFSYFYLMDFQSEKMDIIMNSIPIAKNAMVMRIYLISLMTFIISLIYSAIYFWSLNILGLNPGDALNLKHIIISLSLFVIHFGILLPALQLNTTILYVVFQVIIYLLAKKIIRSNTVLIEGLQLGGNSMILLLIAIAIMIVSIFISYHFYNKREFVRR